MNRYSSVAIIPVIVALGACSSSSHGSNQGQPPPGGDGGLPNVDGGVADGASGDDATGDDGATPGTEYDAALSNAQVVGAAVQSSATGTGKFILAADGITLAYTITQNVSNAQAVNLHIGAPGETGSVTHQLTPVSGQMTGTVSLNTDEQAAIAIDQIYVDVTSAANPGGEIRGQLTAPGATIYVAMPTGAQEVPSVNSQYTAHGSFIMSQDQSSIIYHVVTTAIPTNVLLERGIGATNGQVAYPLTPVGQTIDGNLALTGNDPQDYLASHFYVNIQTASNEAGELRGQLIPVGAQLFTGILAGANEVPPVQSQATGGVQFVLLPDLTTVGYEAVVSGVIPTAMDFDNAMTGQNGPVLYQLTLDQQGALGQVTANAGAVSALLSGATYVNVHTASYTGGELRGQLAQQ
jgi:hypothetical protein